MLHNHRILERTDNETVPEHQAWQMNADGLATWTLARMVNRDDAYGKYYMKEGMPGQCTAKDPVDYALIHKHFAANRIIGLYSTSKAATSRWLTIDIDRHDGDPEEFMERNGRFARHLYV